MNKKYYILVLTFLCLLSGQASYAFGNEGYFQDEFEDYGDHEFAGDPDNGCYGMTCGEDLDEILLTHYKDEEVDDPEYNPCDTCECDPTFCYEEDESLYDDCPSGDDCECYGMGCDKEEPVEWVVDADSDRHYDANNPQKHILLKLMKELIK